MSGVQCNAWHPVSKVSHKIWLKTVGLEQLGAEHVLSILLSILLSGAPAAVTVLFLSRRCARALHASLHLSTTVSAERRFVVL